MATLASRIGDLATRIATEFNTLRNERGLSAFCSGKPGSSTAIGGGIAPYAYTISAANSSAKALAAATGSTTFVIKKNGTQIGTIVFAAAATLGTISLTTATIAKGDNLSIIAPATADATLSDLTFLLVR